MEKPVLFGGGGAGGLAISAESAKDPNKKAAAEEFIRFFYAPENYKGLLRQVKCQFRLLLRHLIWLPPGHDGSHRGYQYCG